MKIVIEDGEDKTTLSNDGFDNLNFINLRLEHGNPNLTEELVSTDISIEQLYGAVKALYEHRNRNMDK
jgi:hypothetical protein